MAEESFASSKAWLAWIFQQMFRLMHVYEQDNFDATRYPDAHRDAFFSDLHARYLSFLIDGADAFYAAQKRPRRLRVARLVRQVDSFRAA